MEDFFRFHFVNNTQNMINYQDDSHDDDDDVENVLKVSPHIITKTCVNGLPSSSVKSLFLNLLRLTSLIRVKT
jgi:hypothetical protein